MSLHPDMHQQLRNLIATMLRVSPAEVSDSTSLAPLNTSLGVAKVRLGLNRLGLASPTGAAPATFGGLLAALSGESPAAATEKPQTALRPASAPVANGGFAGLQVGLDVEDIRSLPVASDYWEHEFYQGTFARSEIAYAVLHVEPRTHLAGFWCAKEALRKCDPYYAEISPQQTAVAHDANGRPYLTMESDAGPQRLPHAVSISHTSEVATAVVVLSMPVPPPASLPASPPAPTETMVSVAPDAKKSRGLAKLFGI
jgi:phosphopantetheine--protein transferase-like protein